MLANRPQFQLSEMDGDLRSRLWYFDKKNGYIRRNQSGKTVVLHQEVARRFLSDFGAPGKCVDHINGDKLDNRRENLRIVDRRINTLNSSKIINASRVTFHKKTGKWQASYRENGKQKHIGLFESWNDAVEAVAFRTKEIQMEVAS